MYNGAVRRDLVCLLALNLLAACAGQRAGSPGPAGAPLPSAQAPAGATALPSYPLVKDDPGIAAITRRLDVAGSAARPALLLARAQEAVAVGQTIRAQQGDSLSLPGSAPGYPKFLACYDLAYRDLEEVLASFAGAPEAPQANYLMGQIHDFRHLDNFEEALLRYHQTVERYPGTEWAKKADARIQLLESMMGGPGDSPHGN